MNTTTASTMEMEMTTLLFNEDFSTTNSLLLPNEDFSTTNPLINVLPVNKALTLTSHPLYILATDIWKVSFPIVLLFGTFGNVMTIVIMSRMTSSESSINVYFSSLAVADLVCLYDNSLRRWARNVYNIHFQNYHIVVCRLIIWLSCAYPISACFLVSLTVHRAVCVVWPHRVDHLLTRRRVIVVNVVIALFFAALYSHSLFQLDMVTMPGAPPSSPPVCYPSTPEYLQFTIYYFRYSELLFYSLLPFLFIAVCNVVLVWKLRAALTASKNMQQIPTVARAASSLSSSSNADARAVAKATSARDKAANSVTLTAIVVSVTFVILTLPTCVHSVFYYAAQHQKQYAVEDLALSQLLYALAWILSDCNHAVNFYLYCLTGKRFRQEFIKVMQKVMGKGQGRNRKGFINKSTEQSATQMSGSTEF